MHPPIFFYQPAYSQLLWFSGYLLSSAVSQSLGDWQISLYECWHDDEKAFEVGVNAGAGKEANHVGVIR